VAATLVFVTHDISGKEILFLFHEAEKKLTGWKLNSDSEMASTKPAFSFSCNSVVPVYATRHRHKDVFMIQTDGTLALWVGASSCIPCKLPR
jgi:hypothetical protein